MANWKCGAARNLPIVERGSWDGAAAKARIFAWAGWPDNPSSSKARRCFLAYDAAEPDLKGSYKLPFADIVEGSPKAISSGLAAAATRLDGTHIPDGVKASARAVLAHYRRRRGNSDQEVQDMESMMFSEALATTLWVNGEELTPEKRRQILQQLESGELSELTFEAVVFRDGPNANYYRFRKEDLAVFARSFAGLPFLRNHDTRDIGSRDGTVRLSQLDGKEFVQSIAITTQRGMQSLAEEQIDRFSIGWYYSGVTCSICGIDLRQCPHWPGRKYTDGKGKNEKVCEVIFEEPRGKETSAVNAPAVDGTRILAQLNALKVNSGEVSQMSEKVKDEVLVEEELEAPAQSAPDVREIVDQRLSDLEAFEDYLRKAAMQAALAGSGLPAVMQNTVRQQLEGREYRPEDVETAIGNQKAVLAKLQEDGVVQGNGQALDGGVRGMMTGLDEITSALTALIEGKQAPSGIRPLSGVREAYIKLSGDYDMKGLFRPENVGLAAVDSTTMAGIVANALNKVVVTQFQKYPRFWEPVVTRRDFATLQQIRWITLGGVGELPTVSEGAAYTEMTWDDATQTSDWVKKGGYLGITLEAMDRDDVSKIGQAAPALAQAAYLTFGKAFSAIFTAQTGTGPDLADGDALFHTNHANLGTSAFSVAAWQATKLAMKKQTELNSGERMGALCFPRYVLCPMDLTETVIEILATENRAGTMDHYVNVDAEGETRTARLANAAARVIEVPFWTSTTNWAAAADPTFYPSIGVGYRFGDSPEIFSVADANSGLMFSNDVMPIKVRWFFAVGPTDHRGLYKHNV